jgi:hypothetical protein
MPQRTFGKNEAGREALGFGGFEHLRQVIGGRHGRSPGLSATSDLSIIGNGGRHAQATIAITITRLGAATSTE